MDITRVSGTHNPGSTPGGATIYFHNQLILVDYIVVLIIVKSIRYNKCADYINK